MLRRIGHGLVVVGLSGCLLLAVSVMAGASPEPRVEADTPTPVAAASTPAAAAPQAPPWPGAVFVFGDCDRAVRTWQRQMNNHGYDFTGTGCYRERTLGAVLDLQRANGLPDSGRLGPLTWEAAWTGIAPKPTGATTVPTAAPRPTATPTPSPTPPPTPTASPIRTPAPATATPAPTGTPTANPTNNVASGPSAAVLRNWGPVVAGDEFDYVGPPDPAKWSTYDGVGHAGNGQRRPSAIRVDGSKVVVSGDANGVTGGMAARFDRRTHGRWEARMAVPRGDSEYHPVLILWPDSNNFPCEGEVDYAETTAADTEIDFFLHYSCSNRQTTDSRPIDLTQWHNYAVEWTPSCITGFLDGVQWFQDCDRTHIPPKPMHQTIQLDYFPDGSAGVEPSSMWVDWVRVYDL